MSFVFVFWVIINIHIILASGVQHSNSIFLYTMKWSPNKTSYQPSPKLIQYYWLYSYVYVTSLRFIYFIAGSLYLLISRHLFCSSLKTPPLWQSPVYSLYLWVCFCFVWFVHLFCILDSCMWNHMELVFISDLFHVA